MSAVRRECGATRFRDARVLGCVAILDVVFSRFCFIMRFRNGQTGQFSQFAMAAIRLRQNGENVGVPISFRSAFHWCFESLTLLEKTYRL